jgi:hypothetical protein
MHDHVWTFKFNPTAIAFVVLFAIVVFGLIFADVFGLVELGDFGAAIMLLFLFILLYLALIPLTIGKYEKVEVEKIAEFEVDRKFEIRVLRWVYVLMVVGGVALGVMVNIVFFFLVVHVFVFYVISSRQKIKVTVTDKGICYYGWLIKWSEIKKMELIDDYVVLYKNPFKFVALPKEAIDIIERFKPIAGQIA